MSDSSHYILRGDDGQLYRVSKAQLAAHKIPAGDPAHAQAAKLAQMHEAAKKAVAPVTPDLICFFAMRDSAGPHK